MKNWNQLRTSSQYLKASNFKGRVIDPHAVEINFDCISTYAVATISYVSGLEFLTESNNPEPENMRRKNKKHRYK